MRTEHPIRISDQNQLTSKFGLVKNPSLHQRKIRPSHYDPPDLFVLSLKKDGSELHEFFIGLVVALKWKRYSLSTCCCCRQNSFASGCMQVIATKVSLKLQTLYRQHISIGAAAILAAHSVGCVLPVFRKEAAPPPTTMTLTPSSVYKALLTAGDEIRDQNEESAISSIFLVIFGSVAI